MVDSKKIANSINELRHKQGKSKVNKSLLYSLDLSNVSTTPPQGLRSKELQALAAKIHPKFQRKLLNFIQNKDRDGALTELISMMSSVEEVATVELVGLYFAATGFVLKELLYNNLYVDNDVKTIISSADRNLKLLASIGEARLAKNINLGIVRRALYFLTRPTSDENYIVELQDKYKLKSNSASNSSRTASVHTLQALGNIATAVREEFKNVRHWLEDVVEQDMPAAVEIDKFISSAEGWAQTLGVAGEEELSAQIADFIRRLAFCIYGASEPEDARLLDLAADWLKINEELISLERAAAVSVDDAAGVEAESGGDSLVVSTVKVMLSELLEIKEIISKNEEGSSRESICWEKTDQLLNNVKGACHFIEQEKLAELIADVRVYINAISNHLVYEIIEQDIDSIADIIASVELVLDGVVGDGSFVDTPLFVAEKAAAYLLEKVDSMSDNRSEEPVYEAANEPELLHVSDNEPANEEVAQKTDQPESEECIVEDESLVNEAADTDQNITNVTAFSPQIASDDDLEILEIFIEEAEEISNDLIVDLDRWKTLGSDEALVDVRRAFHTLKGSGRLAKVEFLSEVAWAVEEMLNAVIEGAVPPNDNIKSLVTYFAKNLPEWVVKISGDRPSVDEMSSIINAARALENGLKADLLFIPGTLENAAEVEETEDFDRELYEIFSNEAAVHLLEIESFIRDHESAEKPHVNEALFRAFHTIEGCAAMSHFDEVAQLTGGFGSYIRELYDNNASFDMAKLQPLLTDYVQITTLQISAIGDDEIALRDHQPLLDMVSTAHTELHKQLAVQHQDNLADEIEAEKAEAEKAEAEKAEAEKAEAEKAEAEKAEAEKAEAEKAEAEKAEAEKAEADEDKEMQGFFVEEGAELLEELTGLLQVWRKNACNKQALGPVLHIVHTLKGSSLLVGLTGFGNVVHEFESLLETHDVNKEFHAKNMLNCLLTVTDGLSVALQDELLREDSSHYAGLIDSINNVPSVAVKLVEESSLPPASAPVVLQIETESKDLPKVKAVVSGSDRSVKISNKLLDNLIADVGEVNVSQGLLAQKNKAHQSQLQELSLTIDRLRQQLRKLEIETETQVLFKVDKASEETGFDPLELDRYSDIQQLSRSLLESISDLEDIRETLQASDEEMSQLLHKESKLTDILLEDLLKTRMVDFSRFSPRFERLVRQLSSDLNKPVTLKVKGGETEIDRFILNELQAPIEHIIRNAMTHAIESPEERALTGKDKEAEINLHLSREGSEIHLIIADDGRGIDTKRIREKAISLGLMADSELLSDNELVQFILKPGFSTVDEVSKLAGRGIGMDIVNDTIRSVGGALNISSTKGEGASFHLIFPYTMAINMALMVEAGGETYAIPNNYIESVVRIPVSLVRENLQTENRVLLHDGKPYFLYELSKLLAQGESVALSSEQRWVHVVLMSLRQQKHAVVIDHLVGNKEVVVKPLGMHMSLIPWLSGSTISSTGEVILMLDLPALVEEGEISQEYDLLEPVVEEKRQPVIMVVDDSITFRKVATKLMLREGYQVVEARDGVDAIEKLKAVQPDIFLLDVEMPRMDGFELAGHIRRAEGMSDSPIVMVTSRTGDKHKNHAKEIGVNDYFGKPFNKEELVKSINSLVEASRASA